jgi:hypothetical protein
VGRGRLLARLALLAGAVGLGLWLFGGAPRQLTLVYALPDPPPLALEVEVWRGGEALRRAELRPGGARQVSHLVRLPDGEYRLVFQLHGPGPSRRLERPLQVGEDGTVVLSLGP